MRTFAIFAALGALFLTACSHETSGSPLVPEPEPEPEAAAGATCTAPGTEHARPASVVVLPVGCSFTRGGSESAPEVVLDAEGLASAIQCVGATPPAIDLASNDVYLVRYTMSPAHAGIAPLDDGTTVTLVTRFRQPCPNDPMPMPMDAKFAFLLPKNAVRTFHSGNCTLPLHCR